MMASTGGGTAASEVHTARFSALDTRAHAWGGREEGGIWVARPRACNRGAARPGWGGRSPWSLPALGAARPTLGRDQGYPDVEAEFLELWVEESKRLLEELRADPGLAVDADEAIAEARASLQRP